MVCKLVRVEGRHSEGQVEEVDLVDFEEVPVLLWRVLHPNVEVQASVYAHKGDRPERPVHQLLVSDDCGEFVEGNAREASYNIMVGN